MKNGIKRFLLGIGAMVMALGSSLSSMEGGAALTAMQIGQIPLIAWFFAIGAFVAGVVGSNDLKMPKMNKAPVLMVLFLILPVAGCATYAAQKEAPKPASFEQVLTKAQSDIKSLRESTNFVLSTSGKECVLGFRDDGTAIINMAEKVCAAAEKIRADTREYRDKIDLMRAAYLAANKNLNDCRIEWKTSSGVVLDLPCKSQSDQILAGLISLDKLLPGGGAQ